MKVLVIGAAGKTGSAVVEQAVAAGHEVTAFVHSADGYEAPAGVRVVGGDAADGDAMDAAVRGRDAVETPSSIRSAARRRTGQRRSRPASQTRSWSPCNETASVVSW